MPKKANFKTLESLNVDGIGEVRSGLLLEHPMFGVGEVEAIYECLSSGENSIRINFATYGSKALVPRYAKLKLAKKSIKEKSILRSLIDIFK